MTNALEIVEQFLQEKHIPYRRIDDGIELSFYGYPVDERYRIVYVAAADAVVVVSHGIAYPRPDQEEEVLRTVLTWNYEMMGACWSFDKNTRGICADTTLYLGGQPLNPAQFGSHFFGLVSHVRGKHPELLRMILQEPGSDLDDRVKAQLEKLLQQQQTDTPRGRRSRKDPPAGLDAGEPPEPSAGR